MAAARLTLAVTVRLGIPVLAACGFGLLLYHSTQRTSSRSVANRSSVEGGENGQKACCWLGRRCLPTVRDHCPAFVHPEMPCWQVTKTPAGRLRTECLSCVFFLPYLRRPVMWAPQPDDTAAQRAARR